MPSCNHQASLSGTAELATPSVRDLSGWTGFRLGSGRGLGPLAASGPFDLTNGVLSLTKTVMALDGMNGQGNIKIDFTGDKPRVTAALGMDRLDLNAYAGSADRRQASQAAGDDDWSDGELDFAPLRALEAKLSLAVSELRLGGVRTGKANIAAELGGGVLDLSVNDAELYGGRASGRLVLNGSRPVPALQAAIRAENVEGAALLGSGIGLDALTGTTSLTLSLAGVGRSGREVVSTLRGTAEFRMVDGALRDLNLLKMLRDVKKDILAGWQPAAASRTVFRELSAHFALEDGIATQPRSAAGCPGIDDRRIRPGRPSAQGPRLQGRAEARRRSVRPVNARRDRRSGRSSGGQGAVGKPEDLSGHRRHPGESAGRLRHPEQAAVAARAAPE